MPSSKNQIFFFISAVIFFILQLFHSSSQIQSVHDFPLLDSSQFRNSYCSITRNKKLQKGEIKSVEVHDDTECIQHCREVDSCGSVDFKKKPLNGRHQCKLCNVAMKIDSLIDDDEFEHISLQRTNLNCLDVLKKASKQTLNNSVYVLTLVPLAKTQVYCDMVTGDGGWTVIQKRFDGSVDFYRDWNDYKKGFGNKSGEYWLGLDTIHAMTSQGSYKLRVDLEDFKGNTRYAEYDSFHVADEADYFRLNVGSFSGTAGDSLAYHKDKPFSTMDNENSVPTYNCPQKYRGGWWYWNCHKSNLNGPYYNEGPLPIELKSKGIHWHPWPGHGYSLKRVEMKIKPRDS